MSETERVDLDAIVFDPTIHARAGVDDATVDQYADAMLAGDTFPPIELEPGTLRLIAGWHRAKAARKAGLAEIDARFVSVPDPLVYQWEQDRKHGKPATDEDARKVAERLAERDGDEFDAGKIAKILHLSDRHVRRYLESRIKERERRQADGRRLRELAVHALTAQGWSGRQVGRLLDVDEKQVRNDGRVSVAPHLDDPSLVGRLIPHLAAKGVDAGTLSQIGVWLTDAKDPDGQAERAAQRALADIRHALAELVDMAPRPGHAGTDVADETLHLVLRAIQHLHTWAKALQPKEDQ